MTERIDSREEITPLLLNGNESGVAEHSHVIAEAMESCDVTSTPEVAINKDNDLNGYITEPHQISNDSYDLKTDKSTELGTGNMAEVSNDTGKGDEHDIISKVVDPPSTFDVGINCENDTMATHENGFVKLKESGSKLHSASNPDCIDCESTILNGLGMKLAGSVAFGNEYLKPFSTKMMSSTSDDGTNGTMLAECNMNETYSSGNCTHDTNTETAVQSEKRCLRAGNHDQDPSIVSAPEVDVDVTDKLTQETEKYSCKNATENTAHNERYILLDINRDQDTESILMPRQCQTDDVISCKITCETEKDSCKNSASDKLRLISGNQDENSPSVVPGVENEAAVNPDKPKTKSPSRGSQIGLDYDDRSSSTSRPSVTSSSFSSSTPPTESRHEGIDIRVEVSKKHLEKSLSGSSICSFPTQSTLTDFCRICHCEGDAELGPLIAPCRCRGSLRYVHQACLQQWIKSSDSKQCELCGYQFIMDSKLKPFHKWKKLAMSTTERRKIMCSVMFHIIAITCVIWSLYVLIERTANEIKVGQLQWPFWTKLVVVAIGFTGGLVFMYVQCKVYFQLWKRLKAFNRVIYIKNNPPSGANTPREENTNGAVTPHDMRESVGSLESSNRQPSSQFSNEQVTSPQSSGAVIIEFGPTRK